MRKTKKIEPKPLVVRRLVTQVSELQGSNLVSEEDTAFAHGLYSLFIQPAPIDLELETPADRRTLTTFTDGRLHMRIKTSKVGFMLAHELGHLFAATDAQLFAPNLGMVNPDDGISGSPEDVMAETTVFAAQRALALHFGDQVKLFNEERVTHVFKCLCAAPKEWKKLYEAERERVTFALVAAELDRKAALVRARTLVEAA